MASINGAAIVARMLQRAGVERVFSLSGNQILPLYDAFIDVGIQVTDTRHEAAAMHMADAWATLTGKPGVCLVTAGPGHLNTVGAAANTWFAESPVLWLSGGSDIATDGQRGFQEIEQIAVASPITKGALRTTTLDDIPGLFGLAWRTMLEGVPGPVHITLPADLLQESAPAGNRDIDIVPLEPESVPPDNVAIAEALERLASAKRPLILASPSACRGQAGARLRQLGNQTGVPWLPVESVRGLIDPYYNGLGSRFRDADCVLLIAPRDFVVVFGGSQAFDPDATLIQIHPTQEELDREPHPALAIRADAASALEKLIDGSGEHQWNATPWREALDAARAAARARLEPLKSDDSAPIHPMRLAAELTNVIPSDAILAQDGGEFSQWLRWEFATGAYMTLVNGKFGMIGDGIPYAIGAKLACPDRMAIAILGDGTFGFHGMEFDTAVRHNIPIIAIVGNDAAWAAERHRQVRIYGEDRLVAADLLPTRYDLMVEALGGHGELVEQPSQIIPAFERAVASGKPACLNVMIQSVPSPAQLH